MKAFLVITLLLTGCAIKRPARTQPTAADEQLMRDFYGKPYLDTPKGWHWVCYQGESERCFIDKN